ncbi:helicase associated domain-containing protein [Streptomyces achromogenes]|uniref:helicase associated domain-containing protein n=1 Tax=Streptomyces achromogenes TaxID=67255 RepID=UPI003720BB72
MKVLPGFTVHGMDVGKWLARQRKPEVWAALAEGRRERLKAVGVTPLATASAPMEPDVLAEPFTAQVSVFDRGVAALAQARPARVL